MDPSILGNNRMESTRPTLPGMLTFPTPQKRKADGHASAPLTFPSLPSLLAPNSGSSPVVVPNKKTKPNGVEEAARPPPRPRPPKTQVFWTPSMDKLLLELSQRLVLFDGRKDWVSIAEAFSRVFPGRSKGSIKAHFKEAIKGTEVELEEEEARSALHLFPSKKKKKTPPLISFVCRVSLLKFVFPYRLQRAIFKKCVATVDSGRLRDEIIAWHFSNVSSKKITRQAAAKFLKDMEYWDLPAVHIPRQRKKIEREDSYAETMGTDESDEGMIDASLSRDQRPLTASRETGFETNEPQESMADLYSCGT